MIDVVAGSSLTVRIAAHGDPVAAGVARIAVGVADPALARALTGAIAEAVSAAVTALAVAGTEHPPVVRVRSRNGLARDPGRFSGAIAIVPVTARNARHLVALVDGIRAAGAVGVQLVWDGSDPPRADIERDVFAVLERARATPGEPPVVLAACDQPVSALHVLVAHRPPRTRNEEPR